MKVLNFGSLNIDYVYQVSNFVTRGESITSSSYRRQLGGKGLNQSVALARAGAEVLHVGCVGSDGEWLKSFLAQENVDVRFVRTTDEATGHAMIQVGPDGDNAIVLHGGANMSVGKGDIESAFAMTAAGDYLVTQNEISYVPQILKVARALGMITIFNPAPFTESLLEAPLSLVDYLILNQTEATGFTGEHDPKMGIMMLRKMYPASGIILTMGAEGVLYAGPDKTLKVPTQKVESIDTTGAGDCFIGFFVAGLASGKSVDLAIEQGCRAASICVTRPGAAESFPKNF